MVVVDAVLELQCSSHQCIEVLHEFCCKEAGVKKADRMSHYNFRKGIALHRIDETYGSRFFQAVIMQRRQSLHKRKRPREEMLLPSSLSAMTVDSSVVCTMTVDSSVCCCFAINKPFVERVGWVTSFVCPFLRVVCFIARRNSLLCFPSALLRDLLITHQQHPRRRYTTMVQYVSTKRMSIYPTFYIHSSNF